MADLTPTERNVLRIIHQRLRLHQEVSILVIADVLGVSKSAAQRHMDALREKGRLRGPRVVGEWALTKAGENELEKRSLDA